MNPDINFDDFYSLSVFLLGIPLPQLQTLDRGQAQTYVTLLETNLPLSNPDGQTNDLVRFQALLTAWHLITKNPPSQWSSLFENEVLNNADDTLWQQAQRVIMLWYAGMWPGASVDALTSRDPQNYPNLLSWVLAPDQHAMGVPKGLNYWSALPAGATSEKNS